MASYELAQAAEADLKNIALYTISEWGPEQAARYGAILDAHFTAVANGKARTRIFLRHRPELHMSRIKHHHVFHLVREKQCPIIPAVFHERMNLMSRLRDRLDA